MNSIRRTCLLLCIVLFIVGGVTNAAFGDDYTGAKVTVVKKATTTADGRKMAYPKTDNPEVTALLVELPPGGETGWHLHPVPVYAYVLSGTLTAETGDGGRREYREGEAIFEVVSAPHNGKNLGQIPVRLIVFYTGEEGKPVTIRLEHK